MAARIRCHHYSKSDLDVVILYIENNVELHSKRKGLMATLERAEDAEAP